MFTIIEIWLYNVYARTKKVRVQFNIRTASIGKSIVQLKQHNSV